MNYKCNEFYTLSVFSFFKSKPQNAEIVSYCSVVLTETTTKTKTKNNYVKHNSRFLFTCCLPSMVGLLSLPYHFWTKARGKERKDVCEVTGSVKI